MLRVTNSAKVQGLRVAHVLAFVHREEGRSENLAKEGHILESIFTENDIV